MVPKRRDSETDDTFQARYWQWWAGFHQLKFEDALRRINRDAPYIGGAMLDYEEAAEARAWAFRQQFAFRHGYDPLDT